ncbi:4841_t:CDS:1, partial [Ambispora gerdemannii]
HISSNCEKPRQNSRYRDNAGGNPSNRNNANSPTQNNVRPNMDGPQIDTNVGNKNGNVNDALLVQLQALTNNLQMMVENQNTTNNNALLATHDYLASEKKQKATIRHEPYVKEHNTRSRQNNNDDKSGNPLAEETISDREMDEAGPSTNIVKDS